MNTFACIFLAWWYLCAVVGLFIFMEYDTFESVNIGFLVMSWLLTPPLVILMVYQKLKEKRTK